MATPKEQLLSRTVYDTDGTTTIWEFAFSGGYLDPAHVKAYTVNAAGTRTDLVINPATDLIGQFQLRIQPALAAGLELVIYRDTPKNLPLVDFTDESGFSEIALDTNAKQGVFIAAEAIDTVNALDVAAAIDAAERAGISATSAQSSQGAAAGSANAAANSATAAANSASASQTAQLAAESARNVASTEAAAAAVSATSANTSRTQAQDSATAAANSATAAGTSATAASTSQTAAADSATAAAGSATSASASQTASANSATAAANSATAAADSATSAATSAADAATSAASVNPANLVQVTGDQTIAGIKTFSSQVNGKTSGTDSIPAFSVRTTGGSFPTMWDRRGAPFHSFAETTSGGYAPTLSHRYLHDATWAGVYSAGVFNRGESGPGAFVIHHLNSAGGEHFAWQFNGAHGGFTSPGNIAATGNITAGGTITTMGNITADGDGRLRSNSITNAAGTGAPNFPNGITAPSITVGALPTFQCRAWVNFNGTGTVAIRASGNVSSITDNGVGDYTVNFTTAMPDANYALTLSCRVATGDAASCYQFGASTTPSVRIRTAVIFNGSLGDSDFVSAAIFR